MGGHYDYLCVPPAGACGIERPHGERLVLACCAAVTASFSGGSASPLVDMLVLSKTVSVTLFGAREALSGRL